MKKKVHMRERVHMWELMMERMKEKRREKKRDGEKDTRWGDSTTCRSRHEKHTGH
jgi:hypothetical protein